MYYDCSLWVYNTNVYTIIMSRGKWEDIAKYIEIIAITDPELMVPKLNDLFKNFDMKLMLIDMNVNKFRHAGGEKNE